MLDLFVVLEWSGVMYSIIFFFLEEWSGEKRRGEKELMELLESVCGNECDRLVRWYNSSSHVNI